MKVACSILSVDFANAWDELRELDASLDYYHMDVMDGIFVPNISFGPSVIKSLRNKTKVPFDTHLMIENPLLYIEDFVKAGSDMISFHLEAKSDPLTTINKIHDLGVKAGIALKPRTPIEDVIPYLDKIDYILVMSVEPGFGGQSFMSSALDKIRKLSELKETLNLNYLISVDGGINLETARLVVAAGIDFAVVGSYLLDKNNPKAKLGVLKHI